MNHFSMTGKHCAKAPAVVRGRMVCMDPSRNMDQEKDDKKWKLNEKETYLHKSRAHLHCCFSYQATNRSDNVHRISPDTAIHELMATQNYCTTSTTS